MRARVTDQDGQNCEGRDGQTDGQIWGINKNGKKTNESERKFQENMICK